MPPYYKCDRCSYETTVRSTFLYHLQRKKPCKPKYSTKDCSVQLEALLCINKNTETEFVCEKCRKYYSTVGNLKRHASGCKGIMSDEVTSLLRNMETQLRELRDEINQKQNTHAVNVTKNTQLNITCLGNENVSYITERTDYEEFMWKCIDSIENFVDFFKYKYSNPDHPENFVVKRVNPVIKDIMFDEVVFIDGNKKKQIMSISDFLSIHSYPLYKQVFNFVGCQLGMIRERAIDFYQSKGHKDETKIPAFCPLDTDTYERLRKFHFNIALAIDYDAGIDYEDHEIDEDQTYKNKKTISRSMLECMQVIRSAQKQTAAITKS